MTIYTVHINREMRVTYEGIEADSPEQAALEAKDGRDGNAFAVDDEWQGEAFSAVVIAEDHEENDRSPVINFKAERLRKAAPKLLSALTWLLDDLADAGEDRNPETGEEYDSVAFARATIAEVDTGRQS